MISERPTVFVIDDDPSVRRATERLLRAEGFAVETFASGSDFLGRQNQHRRGCVVLDVRMPGLSGFEVLQCLARSRRTLPVILVTGHGDVPMASRARDIGCAGFLAKPFERGRGAARGRAGCVACVRMVSRP